MFTKLAPLLLAPVAALLIAVGAMGSPQPVDWKPVCTALNAERAKLGPRPSGSELADLLNAAAYGIPGWRLSSKNAGTYCIRFDLTPVACDILIGPDNQLYDVIIAAGEAAVISCPASPLGPPTADRPPVQPIKSGDTPPPPPPDCPACPECPKPVCPKCPDPTAEIQALRELIVAQTAVIESLKQQVQSGGQVKFPNYTAKFWGGTIVLKPDPPK